MRKPVTKKMFLQAYKLGFVYARNNDHHCPYNPYRNPFLAKCFISAFNKTKPFCNSWVARIVEERTSK